jgi:hypothetical protein
MRCGVAFCAAEDGAEEGAERGEGGGGDADAGFDGGPDGEIDGVVYQGEGVSGVIWEERRGEEWKRHVGGGRKDLQRKSGDQPICSMDLRRTKEAMQPLEWFLTAAHTLARIRCTYMAPKHRMSPSETFDARFICRFHTKITGIAPKVQSMIQIMAACAYVILVTRSGFKQSVPRAPVTLQNEDGGEHWKITKRKRTKPVAMERAMVAQTT